MDDVLEYMRRTSETSEGSHEAEVWSSNKQTTATCALNSDKHRPPTVPSTIGRIGKQSGCGNGFFRLCSERHAAQAERIAKSQDICRLSYTLTLVYPKRIFRCTQLINTSPYGEGILWVCSPSVSPIARAILHGGAPVARSISALG